MRNKKNIIDSNIGSLVTGFWSPVISKIYHKTSSIQHPASKIKYLFQRTQIFHLLIAFSLVVSLSGCLKIGEYYAGLNLQPNTEETPALSGLNVYGVLKAGQSFDTINHFFEVQRMLDVLNFEDAMIVDNATITLERTNIAGDSKLYQLDYVDNAVYTNTSIVVESGDCWTYQCISDSIVVTAECVVPNSPVFEVNAESNRLNIEIEADSTAHMYLVYLIDGEHYLIEDALPDPNANTHIDLLANWDLDKDQAIIYVFAYDKNLREYQTTSNTFFKPNAFRPSYSTVNGGYGTFGAVSSAVVRLRF